MSKPKISVSTETIDHGSNLTLKFEGENYGDGPLDTRVTIDAGTLLWISWPEKEKFIKELQSVINKYAI